MSRRGHANDLSEKQLALLRRIYLAGVDGVSLHRGQRKTGDSLERRGLVTTKLQPWGEKRAVITDDGTAHYEG